MRILAREWLKRWKMVSRLKKERKQNCDGCTETAVRDKENQSHDEVEQMLEVRRRLKGL